MDGNQSRSSGPEVLGDDVHAQKGQPRNQNAAVQSDPTELEQGFVGKEIHTYYADGKERHHGGRDGDTSEKGFLARLGMAIYPDSLVSQQDRQEAYEQFETTDDHMMHIIGTAYDEEGKFYYILKNSWGKIGPYKGLIYMSKEYFRAKTISVVLPKRCFD